MASAAPLEAPKPESAGPRAKPFLKWVGGKTQLLGEILARTPSRYERYFEPFIGGGAVYFAMQPERAFISDINPDLVLAYSSLRDEVEEVIEALSQHRAEKEYYYHVRSLQPDSLSSAEATARLIFMNRTCFNGLYRVNKKGQFNVPFGRYKNPRICDATNLRMVSEALQNTDVQHYDVWQSLKRARKGDFVYLDPPYDPISPTASFTSYAKEGFGRREQERLAQTFERLSNRGVYCMLSNSDTPFIRDLYEGYNIGQVFARRAINRKGSGRGAVPEVLVTNY